MERKFSKFKKLSNKPRTERKEEVKRIDAEIESLVWGGKGLARVDGKVFFVAKSAPLDKVRIAVTKEKSDYGEGEIEKIIYPSPFRMAPVCPHFSKCGGCQFLHINYRKQLEEKERITKEVLRRWTEEARFEPIVPSPMPIGYRHSGDFHLFLDRGALKLGFYEPESHRIVPFDHCHLFSDAFNDKLREIKSVMEGFRMKEKLFKLNLSSDENDRDMVLAVSLKEMSEQACRFLLDELNASGLKGTLFVGTRENEEILRSGDVSLSYALASEKGFFPGGIKLKYDTRSFTQADYRMNRAIVDDVLSMMSLSRHEKVLELYSGIGNFTLPIASCCKEVTAVESSRFAVADAKDNAAANGCENIQHLEGSVVEWIVKLIGRSARFDAVLLDPPRTGAFEVLAHLPSLSPRRVVYVSCSLPTLDRDLRRLSDFGFRPKIFRTYDLFPQTYGIETAVLLEAVK